MSDTIHTLQEFMTHTKGIVYILMVCYLIGFTWFWRFLHNREPKDNTSLRK